MRRERKKYVYGRPFEVVGLGCRSGKIGYDTGTAAKAKLKRLTKLNQYVRAEMNVYPCPDCGRWHIGHTPRCRGAANAWREGTEAAS